MQNTDVRPSVRSLTIQVPAHLVERMDIAARADDRSRSSFLRQVITAALEGRGDGKETTSDHARAV